MGERPALSVQVKCPDMSMSSKVMASSNKRFLLSHSQRAGSGPQCGAQGMVGGSEGESCDGWEIQEVGKDTALRMNDHACNHQI